MPPRHGHWDQWRFHGSICQSGRPHSTFTIRQNWIAASENTGGRPGRPALIAIHAMSVSVSSQINSDPRRLKASLQDFHFVVRERTGSGFVMQARLAYQTDRVNPAKGGGLQQRREVAGLGAIAQSGSIPDQPSTCNMQAFENAHSHRAGRFWFKIERPTHNRQHPGLDCVGFGSGAMRFGKLARLKWVDADQRQLLSRRHLEGLGYAPVGSNTTRAKAPLPNHPIKARKPCPELSKRFAVPSSSRKTSKWDLEMSTPMV